MFINIGTADTLNSMSTTKFSFSPSFSDQYNDLLLQLLLKILKWFLSKRISSYICWMPNPLVQCSPLFLSNQIQLYKPNSVGIAGVILSADAWAHPATGALRAWAQKTTPQKATQILAIMPSFTHSSLKLAWWLLFFLCLNSCSAVKCIFYHARLSCNYCIYMHKHLSIYNSHGTPK